MRGSREISLVPSLHRLSPFEFGGVLCADHFLSKPAISLSEQASGLISSPNVSTVDEVVHGHQAIVFLSP